MKCSKAILLASSLLLISCSSDKEVKQKVEPEDEAKPTVILAPHLKTLNQAKAMEQTLQDAEDAREKKMDEQVDATEVEEPN